MKLVVNELYKIFKKRSIYVFLFAMLCFVIYTTYYYKYKIIYQDFSSIRGILINFFVEYEALIIIFLIFVSSGIISDEYANGTIKQLLISPYKRVEIIISKYIALFIMMLFIILYIFLLQLIIGRLFFDYSSLNIAIIKYVGDKMLKINIFNYLLKVFLLKLPLFMMIIVIAVFFGILTLNTSFTSIMSFTNYFLLTTLLNSNIAQISKYFINSNWDFSKFLYNDESYMLSLIIYCVYFTFFVLTSIFIIDKRDIKNI